MSEKKPAINMYDNDTLKWSDSDGTYCLHVMQDDAPMNPRRDWDNLSMMACWHSRYSLGDEINEKSPVEFWQRLVREIIDESDVFEKALAGEIEGFRIEECEDDAGYYDIYETYGIGTILGRDGPKEVLDFAGVAKDAVAYYIIGEMGIGNCQSLLEPYAEWLPLWLYDHSGITMSCGRRSCQYADRWDSGQVGWIVMLKSTVFKETLVYVLDENGERIKEEHKHPDGRISYSYKTESVTEDNWRDRAIEIMESEVEVYDQFLTGEVYGFKILKKEKIEGADEWIEEDSCWGFFGTDILKSGIADEAGHHLLDAIEERKYETGEAELVTRTYYEYAY